MSKQILVAINCLFYILIQCMLSSCSSFQSSPWTWVCRKELCTKIDANDVLPSEKGHPLDVCNLNCGKYGSLWPQPTAKTEIGGGFVPFCPQNLVFGSINAPSERTTTLLNQSVEIFKSYLSKPEEEKISSCAPKTVVRINIAIAHPFDKLTLNTDEGYTLSVQKQDDESTVLVTIQANSYFGARHGLETFSQLVAYDGTINALQIVDRALIQDKPFFKYRGITLDTSRSFISVANLKRLIDGMSFNKLNIFHWHITDTHSFPFYSKSVPQLTKYGAYAPRKIYTIEDMENLKEYALVRGIKIIPEFDAPAHVGNGWQWGPFAGKGDLAVCINKEPWSSYCVEPPCGRDVYKDMLDIFDNDVFHMGGDEVNIDCWNSSSEITEYLRKKGKTISRESFIELWGDFQSRAISLLKERSSDKDMSVVMWTSDLTTKEHVHQYLDKKDYIIQIWADGKDPIIPFLIKKGYRVIFSNYDAWYLDCGYGAWVGGAPTNWCAPYKGWQHIYNNSPVGIFQNSSNQQEVDSVLKKGLILGGSAAMWTEQADDSSVESKIWPRAAALAERLWSNPTTNWSAAEIRMIQNRQRLVERGLTPDLLQPEWCRQNAGLCYA